LAFFLDDRFVWDFWLADDGERHHLWHLQAPKSIGDPDQRHWNATIGHAVSDDLVTWERTGDALGLSPTPAFDDATTWTGSVIRHDGRWFMFYTGNARADAMKRQRIGLATAASPFGPWTKHPGNPVVDLDPRHYEEYPSGRWYDRSLRDPWVYPDPAGRGWRMLFTARIPDGPADGAGCIGQARSDDLLTWETLPPLIAPGISGEMEVPQFMAIDGRFYILFCTAASKLSASFRETAGEAARLTGTHYFVSDAPDGPWRLGPLPFFAADEAGSLYASRLHRMRDGRIVLMGFRNLRPDGSFRGGVSDPIPVEAAPDGALRLAYPVSQA
jgi:beta-fructofuranosidase